MSAQSIYLIVVFLVVFGVVLLVARLLTPTAAGARLEEMAGNGGAGAQTAPSQRWVERIVRLTGPLARLSIPEEGWEHSALRTRFMNAGFRGRSAPMLYFAAKTLLALGLPALVYAYVSMKGVQMPGRWLMVALLVAGGIGYYAPNAVLAQLVRYRKREIFENFPDAIDLMTVCVEAGLGLDAALLRVADEMKMTSRPLAEELHLVTLELRAGSPKEKALRNLALRTGVEEVDTLVAMLIQAERFGTSIADSLRVHAESLRTKRRLLAEERAAKIPVKLVFPLIFCIFPTFLLVALGPSWISIARVLLPRMTGQ
jgi:tight adherence protein C